MYLYAANVLNFVGRFWKKNWIIVGMRRIKVSNPSLNNRFSRRVLCFLAVEIILFKIGIAIAVYRLALIGMGF